MCLLLIMAMPAAVMAQKEVTSPAGTAIFIVPDEATLTRRGTTLLIGTGIENCRLTFDETFEKEDMTLEQYAARTKQQALKAAGRLPDTKIEQLNDDYDLPIDGMDCYKYEARVIDSRGNGFYGLAYFLKNGHTFYSIVAVGQRGRTNEALADLTSSIARSVERK